MHPDVKEILISEEALGRRIRELAQEIVKDYQGLNPLCIGILKGAVPFMAEIIRWMDMPLELDFMAVSTYGSSTKSSGVVRILKDLDAAVEGRHLLVVEDIVDTGLTLSYLIQLLKSRHAASVKVVSLLDKPERRKVELVPDYCGFTVPNVFVVGFGLDYAERYRQLPYVGELKEEVYSK